MRRWIVMVVAALTGVTAAGCGSSGGNPGTPTSATDGGIADMLAMAPDTADVRRYPVTVNLYWKAAEAGKIAIPAPGAGGDDVGRYFVQLTADLRSGVGAVGSELVYQASDPNIPATTGFGLSDVASDISVGAPPTNAVAARGRFDTAAVDKALRADAVWKGALTTPTYHDTTIYRWLDDQSMDMKRVHTGLFTNIGGSRRFAFPDSSTFLYGRDDATIHSLLNTQGGSAASLAADPEYASAAKALDAQHVYSAILLTPITVESLLGLLVIGATPDQMPALKEHMERDALGQYQLAAIGETRTDGAPHTVIVLVNASEDAAKANVAKLQSALEAGQSMVTRQPWSAMLSVDSIKADGKLTIAVLSPVGNPPNVTAWARIVLQADTLLAMK